MSDLWEHKEQHRLISEDRSDAEIGCGCAGMVLLFGLFTFFLPLIGHAVGDALVKSLALWGIR